MNPTKKIVSVPQAEFSTDQMHGLLETLQNRFERNMRRHPGLEWASVLARLEENTGKLASLYWMEQTGGEPDVVVGDTETASYLFFDCSPETPKDRRSICYDPEALASRKTHKPPHSAVGMAAEEGIDLLTEDQYHLLQQTGDFDTKTSSWLATPDDVRSKGGALFGDRRFGRVFIYHNGAESYYGARGFRGCLEM